MTSPKVTIKGMEELLKKMKEMPKEVEEAADKALRKAALDLQGKAQQLAPKDIGDLRGSAFTIVGNDNISKNTTEDKNPKSPRLEAPTADKLNAVIGFSEPYALRQHEHLEYEHPHGGQAKYLEQPYTENRDKYIKSVENAVKKAVEK